MFCTPEMLDQKLLQLRTGYFARVLAVNGDRINVQPLYSAQAVNGKATDAAVVTNVLVAESARHKIGTINRTCMINGNNGCTFNGTISGQSQASLSGGTCSVAVQMKAEGETVNATGTANGTANGQVSGTCSGDVNCSCSTESRTHLILIPISVGDLVYCVVADRDITNNSNGTSGTPTTRHHDISDSVCIALF
jgi:hypothetical protein